MKYLIKKNALTLLLCFFLQTACQSSDVPTNIETVNLPDTNDDTTSIIDEDIIIKIDYDNLSDIEFNAVVLLTETSNEVNVSNAGYEQILNELRVIYAIHNRINKFSLIPNMSTNSISIRFTDDGLKALNNNEYTAWDELNKKYKLLDISNFHHNYYTSLTFDGFYNTTILAEIYSALPGIDEAVAVHSIVPFSAANDICLEIEGELHYYIFDEGSGDCPSGCTEHFYTGFSIDRDFNVAQLGNFVTHVEGIDEFGYSGMVVTDEEEPTWLTDRLECRKWL